MRNLALEGNLVVVIGEHRAQAMTVDSSTGHVLRAGIIAALDNQDALARFGELVGGNRSGASGSDDDSVEVCHWPHPFHCDL